jgi:hypothetical protein
MIKRIFAPVFLATAILMSGVAFATPASASSPTYSVTHDQDQVKAKAKQMGWISRSCAAVTAGAAANDTYNSRRPKPPTTTTRTPWGTIAIATVCVLDHFFVSGSSASKIYAGAAAVGKCVRVDVWVTNSIYSWDKSRTKYHIIDC